MFKVFNSSQLPVTLVIENSSGEKDGIHLQPHGRVTLGEGFFVSPNSLAANPGIVIVQPSTSPTQPVEAKPFGRTGKSVPTDSTL